MHRKKKGSENERERERELGKGVGKKQRHKDSVHTVGRDPLTNQI